MTEKEFQELIKEGERLFISVLRDLNRISGEYIHVNAREPDGTYRRFEDKQEICVALALLKRKQDEALNQKT